VTIHSIGVDIVEINRIESIIKKYGTQFLNKIFTPKEVEYCSQFRSGESFAGRFAAKEAVLKATGFGLRQGMRWTDIEIINNDIGKPMVRLSGKTAQLLENFSVYLSLSHTKTTAIAMVVVELR
jgi:holo-[acyl-carrier protein] synthase